MSPAGQAELGIDFTGGTPGMITRRGEKKKKKGDGDAQRAAFPPQVSHPFHLTAL